MEPKQIKFSDIKVGDKIRVIDEHELEVAKINGSFIYDGYGEKYYICVAGWNRKFTLLERPLPKHKYAVGQKVSVTYPACGFKGTITELIAHNNINEPRYVVKEHGEHCLGRIYPESELTPIDEDAWEPKWGEFVKYKGVKHVVTCMHPSECQKGRLISICNIDNDWKRIWTSELSKWEGD